MSEDSAAQQDWVGESLRRIEELIGALDSLSDRAAREPARALLEVVLDLHALALARMTATVAGSAGGPALLLRLADDAAVRAVLLLHGLHPEPVEMRVGNAIDALRPQFALRGLGLKLVESSCRTRKQGRPPFGKQRRLRTRAGALDRPRPGARCGGIARRDRGGDYRGGARSGDAGDHRVRRDGRGDGWIGDGRRGARP